MKIKGKYIFLIIVMVFLLSSCVARYCSFYEFYYPVNSDDDSWEYLGKIVVTSNRPGSFFDISDKTVIITISDRKRRKFLYKTIKFTNCGEIDHDFKKVKWENLEELELILYEEIDESYNNKLNIQKYPLCKLKFEYDAKDNKFHLTERENLGGRKKVE